MTQAIPLEDRVTDLERRMDDVERLASGTDREVAGWQITLNNHTKLLNTIRDGQVDQGKRLAKLETEMRDGFAKMDANFAMMEDKFELLRQGQDDITKLLTKH